MTIATSKRINQDQFDALIPTGGSYEWQGPPLEQPAEKVIRPIGFTDQELQAAVDAAAAVFVDRQANELALLTKAKGAVDANSTYLNIATPTAAQVAAQVKALTRQMNALIRITAGEFDTTDGT